MQQCVKTDSGMKKHGAVIRITDLHFLETGAVKSERKHVCLERSMAGVALQTAKLFTKMNKCEDMSKLYIQLHWCTLKCANLQRGVSRPTYKHTISIKNEWRCAENTTVCERMNNFQACSRILSCSTVLLNSLSFAVVHKYCVRVMMWKLVAIKKEVIKTTNRNSHLHLIQPHFH